MQNKTRHYHTALESFTKKNNTYIAAIQMSERHAELLLYLIYICTAKQEARSVHRKCAIIAASAFTNCICNKEYSKTWLVKQMLDESIIYC